MSSQGSINGSSQQHSDIDPENAKKMAKTSNKPIIFGNANSNIFVNIPQVRTLIEIATLTINAARDLLSKIKQTALSNSKIRAVVAFCGKIVTYLQMNPDEETLQSEDTDLLLIIVTVIKEAVVGCFFAIIVVALTIIVFPNIPLSRMHKQTMAKLLRSETDVLRNFEEQTGWMLVPKEEHASMMEELDKALDTQKKTKAALERREEDWYNVDGEWSKLTGEVRGLKEALHIPLDAPVNGVRNRNSPDDVEAHRPNNNILNDKFHRLDKNDIVRNFATHKKNWCGKCEWTGPNGEESCEDRARAIKKEQRLSSIAAIAEVMVANRACTIGYYPERMEEKGGFCGDCLWDDAKVETCDAHVRYLAATTKRKEVPVFVHQLAVMENERCAKTKDNDQPSLLRQQQQQRQTPQQIRNMQQEIEKNFAKHKGNFCMKCQWEGSSMTCESYAKQLKRIHKLTSIKAIAKVMAESAVCTNSHHEETIERMGGFCGACMWGSKATETCDGRVEYLMQSKGTPRHVAKLAAMEKEACVAGGGGGGGPQTRLEGEPEQYAVARIVENFDKHKGGFCPDCEWDGGVGSCGDYAKKLKKIHHLSSVKAIAMVMVEEAGCTNDYYRTKIEQRGGFCGECQWGYKKTETCFGRVEYLMQSKNKPLYVAQLAAMEKEACVVS